MKNMTAEFKFAHIYDSTDCHVSGQSLRRSIPENQNIVFDLSILKSNADLNQLLAELARQGRTPDAIVFETGARGLPHGLTEISIPTCCIDIDTFGWTRFRLQWAMLFDYVFTWHPSYVQRFQDSGHPRVFALPHAVDANQFSGCEVDDERPFDFGFVGNSGLPQYQQRDRVIAALARRFRTNDLHRTHSAVEMVDVYRRSKMVVNVSRAEFPSEANMRCYEAMAAGALLITGIPTELTEWGLREGEHFVGWRSEEEVPNLVEQFVSRKEQRSAIARAGQELTLQRFTYQRCIETMVDVFRQGAGELFAPARRWPADKVNLVYLNYYHRLQLPCAAVEEFRLLRRASRRGFWQGLPMVLKTLRNATKSSLI